MNSYFREKPYRIFYLGFFVLIYFSALLQGVTPLGSLRMPAYVPEKVRVDLGRSAQERVNGYFGENFLYPIGFRGAWMMNHGLLVLDNASPTDLKVNLGFRVFSYRQRTLRISAGRRVLKRSKLVEGWQTVKIPRLMLEPGELLLYFYSPEGTEDRTELGLGEDKEVSVALKDFNLEPVSDYTFREKARIAKQKAFDFINHINYVYTSVIAFLSLLIALALHAREALRR